MRSLALFWAILAFALGTASASQAAILIDFQVGGSSTVTAANSTTITVEIYLAATGSTSVSAFQFAIIWDPTELSYVDNPPVGGTVPPIDAVDSLNSSGPNHAGSGSWVVGGAREFFLNQSLGQLPTAISASTLIAADTITAADGLLPIGSLQFHVISVIDDGIDITGCFSCTGVGPVDGIWNENFQQFPSSETTFSGIQVVPEPSTASLLALGLAGLATARRRRG